jgi:UDP-glucose 4-epimerase
VQEAAATDKGLIALTGATGFVGRHLLSALPRRGYRVRALLRRPAALPESIGAVVGDLRFPQDLAHALADVDCLVHCAGIAHAGSGISPEDYRGINTDATIALAQAASRARVKRFIFLSSIRAQAGGSADGVLTEETEPRPTDDYGRSKLAAERGLAELDLDWVALRPVLVYGSGVKGNLASLVRLARTPCLLPLAAFNGRRSLLSIDNLVDAIEVVLAGPGPLRRPFIVADADALTIGETIAALRAGLRRSPGLAHVPLPLLRAALNVVRRAEWFELLAGSRIVDASALMRLGWAPRVSTASGLAALMDKHGAAA